ncbi:bifunctional demethylmenaquinone methyltransferase/2-methoxy-6-polyprenyl-1,4-benzoquinol methylase UbiE [Tannerella forsythia]|uniref:Demethylmenaquinone methyltransferase n=1 Tax=Tannerella forsythia TaxID=28112 RepID=A0A1D3UWA9_TANFO|nr:bifunctional demethylmenaquinone methyltransferase/2-methoxy-6-polyprenyl-1,4-benzoquinol methylase UbiE [Tannerella forsythia]OLQ21281.1 bifunctional demethylmenaquinone methyltransferase/2-methoxy-6-polyprenyl-1,4-benzoquinol methylase [Tannerella forsythia]SCQ24301.1 Demethylmenaquinone methyltransferase [Tannerella forsythia]
MSVEVERVLPYAGDEDKGTQVRRMFDSIAGRYDMLNRMLSLGMDRLWRRKMVDSLRPSSPQRILDVASGTGDLALLMCRRLQPQQIIAADLSEEMMAVGRRKATKAGYASRISFEHQDCMTLTYSDHSFDAITVAFGVRNFADLERGLSEMERVLRPDGQLRILELSTPKHFPMKQLYALYSRTIIPLVGSWFSLEKSAYRYLPASIRKMPQGREMVRLLERQGFDVQVRTFTGGTCSLYSATKHGHSNTIGK